VLLAGQLAAQLRDSSLFDRLRDQTRRLSRVGYEAERRYRSIQSLQEYFESSAEGILVLDQNGKVLYANNRICQMTGFAADAVQGRELAEVVSEELRPVTEEIVDTVLDGANIEAIDLQLSTTSGALLTASVTTSTVLSSQGAVVLALRDVTKQRSLESQLQHTNEFLENLIDSAVDAIIAADMRGRVILFNKGAESIFGYRAEDVVGRMAVTRLYPEGVPRQVMKMLRSDSAGGRGRLEQTRREVITQRGDLVPVNMTASIIYDGDREVATVGIFSDLRDRIRIEQRLLQAQEQIERQERQAMVAELAGAAAHELNQPLTSIIGYAQLIERTTESDAPHQRYTKTIITEAERMAEIVKKIGRITHFEPVASVGSANIVDLEKSAGTSSGDIIVPAPADDEPTARVTIEEIMRQGAEEITQDAEELRLDPRPQGDDS
jgi:PAS domain S-box-containing protein